MTKKIFYFLILSLCSCDLGAIHIGFVSKNSDVICEDDTALIQCKIDQAPDDGESVVLIAPGEYCIRRPLVIRNKKNFHLLGAGLGTVIRWKGDSESEAISIVDTKDSEFSYFNLEWDGRNCPAIGIKITSTNQRDYSTNNIFKNLDITGVREGIRIGGDYFEIPNDRHLFKNVNISTFFEKGMAIYGSKAIDHFLYNVKINSAEKQKNDYTKGLYVIGGSFTMLSGGIGKCWIDYEVVEPYGQIVISHVNSEDTKHLISVERGCSTEPLNITIEGCRFTKRQLLSDAPFMKFSGDGYVGINSNLFDIQDDNIPLKIERGPFNLGNYDYEVSYNHFQDSQVRPIDWGSGPLPTLGLGNVSSQSGEGSGVRDFNSLKIPSRQKLGARNSPLRDMLRKVLFRKNLLFLFSRYHNILHRIFNVKEMGAVGDGVHDDTEAFIKALTYATLHPEKTGIVLIPEGSYRITKTLRTYHCRGAIVVGEGSEKTKLIWEGNRDNNHGAPVDDFVLDGSLLLDIVNCYKSEFRDFSIRVRPPFELNTAIRVTCDVAGIPEFGRYEFSQVRDENSDVVTAVLSEEDTQTKIDLALQTIQRCCDGRGLPIDASLRESHDSLSIINSFLKNPHLTDYFPSCSTCTCSTPPVTIGNPALLRSQEERIAIQNNRFLLKKNFSFLPTYPCNWQNVTSTQNVLENIEILADGAANLFHGVSFGSGRDANNDFHLVHYVWVSNYQRSGFRLCNSQIFNVFFVNCSMYGNPNSPDTYGCVMGSPSEGTIPYPGEEQPDTGYGPSWNFSMGSMSWIGGWGGANQQADFYLGTTGKAPVTIASFFSRNSKQCIQTAADGAQVAVVCLVDTDFSTEGTGVHNILSFNYPGIYSIQDNKFSSRGIGKIRYSHYPRLWESMSFYNNTIKCNNTEVFYLHEPQYHSQNRIFPNESTTYVPY